MAPDGDKIRVTARISKELDTKVHRYYTNLAPAIIEGLELLVSVKEGNMAPECYHSGTDGTGDLMARIGDMKRQIEFLKRQIEIKDSQLEKQAYSLQSLIQVNSALNMKLLPEKTPTYTEEIPQTVKETEITSRAEQVAATTTLTAKEIILEEEPVDVQKDESQSVSIQKAKKTAQAKPEREVVCVQCGKKFSAKSEKAKYCSSKCRTASSRKNRNIQIHTV